MKREQLAARLMATFVAELEEQVELLNSELLALEADPADTQRLAALFRIAHTLKGAARAVEVGQVERVCHRLESLLERARDGAIVLDASHLQLLYTVADVLAEAGQQLRRGDPIDRARIDPVANALDGAAGGARRIAPAPLREVRAPEGQSAPPAPAAPIPSRETGTQVRVDAARLDDLIAASSRLDGVRAGMAERQGDLEGMNETARRMAVQWKRLLHDLRLLEETRSKGRLRDQLQTTGQDIRRIADVCGRLSTGLKQQQRALDHAVRDVGERVRELRMRPFSDACEGLPRAVRDLAEHAGKQVQLMVRGGDVEADRAVLDGVRDAILQLVRNAVDHGIESPPLREARRKPAMATITVSAAMVGDRLEVSVADDGAGLDVAAIRELLTRHGRSAPDSDSALARALFEPGVSTRADATDISGRGVGLDIVRHAADRIRGTVDVTWESGRGSRFILICPPTLATLRAVIVSMGTALFAFPTTAVERLVRVRAADVRTGEGRRLLTGHNGPVPLVSLAHLLPGLTTRGMDPIPAILAEADGRRVAIAVEALVAEQEIVIRPLEVEAGPSQHLSGAALLGPGRIALVLNPVSVIAAAVAEVTTDDGFVEPEAQRETTRTILVVDDSITTRTLEQSILAAAGYRVVTAVDGADGLRRLHEEGADLVVADVEMPGLDGFALCEAMRASQRFRDVPVVLVTALESPEHRARGMEAGADAYITKSAFDQTSLLETVRQLLG